MTFKDQKILLITHQGILGGAERQALGLSKILTEDHNCEVYMLLTFSGDCTNEFREFAKACKVKEVLFVEKPYFLCKKEVTFKNIKRLYWSLKYLLHLRKKLIPYEIDVIVPFLNFPSKIAFFLKLLLPSVKYTFWHQLGLDSWSKDLLEDIAVRNTKCVIANAPNGIEIFKKRNRNGLQTKYYILPQYVSIPYKILDAEKIKQRLGIAPNHLVVGMIAHFRPEKLQFLLVNAFVQLSKTYNHISLVFLGGFHQQSSDRIKDISVCNDLENRIKIFHDEPVEDILTILNVGVLLSEIEGTPNAVLEYMLYGLPILATNHTGCKLILDNSKFLVENQLSEVMKKLEVLINSENIRVSEAERNQKRIKDFDKKTYVQKLEQILT